MAKANTVNRILLVQTAFLGDVILSTPLIRAIRRLYPHAELDAVVIPQTEDVLSYNTNINHVVTFDKRNDRRRSFRETLRFVRARKYDLGIAPHRSLTSSMLMFRGGVKRRIGFRAGFPSLFYTDRIAFDETKPERTRYLDLMLPLTKQIFDDSTELFFDINAILAAKKFEKKTPASMFRLAVAPGSVWATKRWPEESFMAMVEWLKKENIYFVFLGSNKERSLCRRIIRGAELENAVNLAGKTSILEAAAIIDRCDLLVGNDSGPMHIANAVETDVIALFGPTDRSLGFFPYRPNDKVFERDLACRPCSKHGGPKCPKGHFKCMKDLDPFVVGEEISRRAMQASFQEKRQRNRSLKAESSL